MQDDDSGHRTAPDSAAWRGIRTILVPQDIAGVRPRSPARIRRKTPWRPQPDGQVPAVRCGDRDWFSDRLFVESQDGHARSGFGTSITVHLFGVAALIVFFITRPDVITIHMPSMLMPVVVSPPPPMMADLGTPSVEQKPKSLDSPAPPPPPAPVERPNADDPVPAPVEAPVGVTQETGAESRTGRGAEGGVPGGVAGGVPGGGVGGTPGGTGTAVPVRVGANMQAPRKIKHVEPVYPAGALPARSQGAVVIEAVIGPDGKVKDVKVIHSVPALDQAALVAVRQWEYTPPVLNGVAVAVLMTVVVNFAMQ